MVGTACVMGTKYVGGMAPQAGWVPQGGVCGPVPLPGFQARKEGVLAAQQTK